MAAVTICSDFGAQKNKVCHCFHCFPIYFPSSGGTGCRLVICGLFLLFGYLKLPRTEEPGRLQSMGSLGVGHDWATSLSLFTFMHWRRKWQPAPVFLPGESHQWRSLVGCRLWSRTESDMTAAMQQQQQALLTWRQGQEFYKRIAGGSDSPPRK